jgi:hypothetical protein
MTPIVAVRYIANGYILTSQNTTAVPPTLYVATLPEVVFWLDAIFNPPAP